jgi:hypothetical protein
MAVINRPFVFSQTDTWGEKSILCVFGVGRVLTSTGDIKSALLMPAHAMNLFPMAF